MKIKKPSLAVLLIVMAISMLFVTGTAITAGAVTDEHGREIKAPRERRQYDYSSYSRRADKAYSSKVDYLVKNKGDGQYSKAVKNAAYIEECGSCHFVFQPWLLPARSWELMMEGSEDHFGEDLALEKEGAEEILAYLVANSMEYAAPRNKRARKMMRRLPAEPPLSITELPYIKKKHRKIKAKVLQRDSIRTLSNCVACHRTADRGKYDDDNVKIPKK
ncbi:MAG: hypothetical protein ACE5DR_00030 [Thermodesulfobacteriota bacterium]